MANQLRRSLKTPMGNTIGPNPTGGVGRNAASPYLEQYPQAKGQFETIHEQRPLEAEDKSNMVRSLTGTSRPSKESGSGNLMKNSYRRSSKT